MRELIISNGLAKRAADEGGPDLETQFGILTAGELSARHPKLDAMRLAFQVIDRREDGSGDVVGVMVYVVGRTLVMVPSFFIGHGVTTGEMMFLPETSQFLPLSDPWLSWVQRRGPGKSGEVIPRAAVGMDRGQLGETVRKLSDPLVKAACLQLRGVLRTDPDLSRARGKVTDMALGMGKAASEALLELIDDSPETLNAMLSLYSPEDVAGFAKTAAETFAEPEPDTPAAVSLVEPFTDAAKDLTAEEAVAMRRDGYVIRSGRADCADVVRRSSLRDSFRSVTEPGVRLLPSMDGAVRRCLVMRLGRLGNRGLPRPSGAPLSSAQDFVSAQGTSSRMVVFPTPGDRHMLVHEPVSELVTDEAVPFSPELIEGRGRALSSPGDISWGDLLLCPDGYAYELTTHLRHGSCWVDDEGRAMLPGGDPAQMSPMVTETAVVLPPSSRIVSGRRMPETNERSFVPVPVVALDSFLRARADRMGRTVKVASDGGEACVTGDLSDGRPMSLKQASLHLVRDYGVAPAAASLMLADVLSGATPGRMRSETYIVMDKTAGVADDRIMLEAETPSIGYTEKANDGPVSEEIGGRAQSDTDVEEVRRQAIAAAESGVQEVFDVTVLKHLVQRSRIGDDITGDLGLFMRLLDSLCRKLFLLRWHTEAFKKRYGAVKLSALEDGIRNALDSMSELTVFLKLRTVDGQSGEAAEEGDLMQGGMPGGGL